MSAKLLVISLNPHPNPLTTRALPSRKDRPQGARENTEEITCEECYKIKCRGCGWEPSDEQVILVQNGTLTVCPLCGWSPAGVVSDEL